MAPRYQPHAIDRWSKSKGLWVGGAVGAVAAGASVGGLGPWGAIPLLGLGLGAVAWAARARPMLAPQPVFQETVDVLKTPDGSIEVPMVALRGGKFRMGSREYEEEKPVHTVPVAPFTVMQYPVTRTLYKRVMGDDPGSASSLEAPVNSVTWYDAVEFCNRLSILSGRRPCYRRQDDRVTWIPEANGYRLPTESEWELAIRAGTTTKYFFGRSDAQANEYAWYGKSDSDKLQPVGQKKSNPWKLHDMAGNALEWCWDVYDNYGDDHVSKMTKSSFFVASGGGRRVLRGGAFNLSELRLRSAFRDWNVPGVRLSLIGFRCVRGSFPQPIDL